MNDYTSCFIGIPIPEKYHQSFENLLEGISQINPLFKPTYSITPHITVCYLDKQSQTDLPKIAENIKNYLKILKSVELKIGGFGYFREDNPKVLFLDVQYPKALQEFNKVIAKSLSIYSATDNNLPFHPHVTVAWVRDPEAQQAFRAYQSSLKDFMDEVNWSFEITEVALYGADSTKRPEYQEKLISLAVK